MGLVSRNGLGKKPGRKGLGVSGRAAWPHLSSSTSGLPFQRRGVLDTSWHMGKSMRIPWLTIGTKVAGGSSAGLQEEWQWTERRWVNMEVQ